MIQAGCTPNTPMPNAFSQALVIARKDLRTELRGKEALNAAAAFSLVILLLFTFAFDPTEADTRALAGGLIWIVFAFAGVLLLNRSFARELPNDCLDALLTAPLPGAALFLGKAAASFALLLMVELVALPIFAVFYDVRLLDNAAPLILTALLGTWGLTVVGAAFAALTVNIRLRELMLPLLIYPILMPELLGAMQLTTSLLTGGALAGDNLTWLKLMFGFDIIYTALAVALIDFVLVW